LPQSKDDCPTFTDDVSGDRLVLVECVAGDNWLITNMDFAGRFTISAGEPLRERGLSRHRDCDQSRKSTFDKTRDVSTARFRKRNSNDFERENGGVSIVDDARILADEFANRPASGSAGDRLTDGDLEFLASHDSLVAIGALAMTHTPSPFALIGNMSNRRENSYARL